MAYIRFLCEQILDNGVRLIANSMDEVYTGEINPNGSCTIHFKGEVSNIRKEDFLAYDSLEALNEAITVEKLYCVDLMKKAHRVYVYKRKNFNDCVRWRPLDSRYKQIESDEFNKRLSSYFDGWLHPFGAENFFNLYATFAYNYCLSEKIPLIVDDYKSGEILEQYNLEES